MAIIIFMNVPGHGHVNPTLPVVQELVRRGRRVIYYNSEEFRPQIERVGAEFRPYPSALPSQAEIAAAVSRNMARISLLLVEAAAQLTPFMLNELQYEQPGIVIYDSICVWGMQAARVLGLPSVSSITTFVTEGAEWTLPRRDLAHMLLGAAPLMPRFFRARRRLLRTYGKKSLPAVLFPATGNLNIVFTSRQLQPPTSFINDSFRFVGPAINAATRDGSFPFAQLDRRPVTYISLGTLHSADTAFFRHCFQAFADHSGQFILSAGKNTDINTLLPIPPNFLVYPSVPQLEVLQHADLFITHGGMNSVHEGLYFGVPQVVVPHQMEQLLNALQVRASGAGVVLGDRYPYGRVTADELRGAADHVLSDPRFKQAAQRASESLRQAGGYQRAAAEIVAFAECHAAPAL
ncbi:MAG: hypothetical protein MI924_30345 [Chloroflexales bacterium]|nr:hypothetical protein [Chloroflexales bacterium]